MITTSELITDDLAMARRAKAERAFHWSRVHGVDTVHGLAYVREGFHWLRAARAAEAGDVSPRPYVRED